MSCPSWKICHCYSLWVVANRGFVEDVFSTLESWSSDVVRDRWDFGGGCVGINQTRLHPDKKVVFCNLCCVLCLCVIIWDRNLATDVYFVLSYQCKVESLENGEVRSVQVMSNERWQIRECNFFRVVARRRLIKGVLWRGQRRRSHVVRNHGEHLNCSVGVDHASSNLNREDILRKESLKCSLGVVSWNLNFRA